MATDVKALQSQVATLKERLNPALQEAEQAKRDRKALQDAQLALESAKQDTRATKALLKASQDAVKDRERQIADLVAHVKELTPKAELAKAIGELLKAL